MNIHDIFEKYKDKRETIYAVYLDLFDQCNEIRKQRDFAMTLIKFIDMRTEMMDPTGSCDEVVRLMDLKDEDNQLKHEQIMQKGIESATIVLEHLKSPDRL